MRQAPNLRATPGSSFTSVAAPSKKRPARTNPVLAFLGGLARAIGSIVSGKIVAVAIALILVVVIGGVVVVNSPIFAIKSIEVNGSEHVSQQTVSQLIDIPAGTTLFNIDTDGITEALEKSPWVADVNIERSFPDTVTITPVERHVAAIVYISADDVAWAIGDDGYWIAPVSLSVTVDGEGNIIEDGPAVSTADATSQEAEGDSASTGGSEASGDDSSASAGDADTAGDDAEADDASSGGGADSADGSKGTSLTGKDAAAALASHYGAVLFTDVPADVSPSSRTKITSDIVLAGIAYIQGFSKDFLDRVEEMSLPSVDAISAYLDSGVEVALGSPENIESKERVVEGLLDQEQGVTYINVRTPDNPTFRSAPKA